MDDVALVVGAVVVDARGRAFVHRRSEDRALFPGCWDTPGGHVEPGESPLEALARELREETGWRLAGVVAELGESDWVGDDGVPRRELDYLVEVDGDLSSPRLERPQHVDFAWIGPDELDLLLERRTPAQLLLRGVVEQGLRVASARMAAMRCEVRDVSPGLWLWRVEHPDWSPEADWEPLVASTCVASGGEIALLDPIAPPAGATEVWERLDAQPPTLVVVLKPDHVRDVDLFVRRYGARPFGPSLFWRHDVPEAELEPVEPGSELPGGLVALYDGRGRNETPLWLPGQRALVFADALTAPRGELRVWMTPWHEERALPALRALLELPFELVIVSHGEPVHDRAAFERALELPPWSGT